MPPVSEAQRRLMRAAANTKGGAGGVPQSVGEDFASADKPGKLPEHAKSDGRAKKLYRGTKVSHGYAEGGKVKKTDKADEMSDEDLKNWNAFMQESARQNALSGHKANPFGDDGEDGKARGGKIAHVAGKPIGKDDGVIPAQKGEFVVRKSAVKKLGDAALNEVNKGNISKAAKLYRGAKVSHAGS
jgi:hypothetical protein